MSHYPEILAPGILEDALFFYPDRMHLEIVGGKTRTHPISKDLVLDGESLSKDTSFLPSEGMFDGDEIYWSVNPTLNVQSNTLILNVNKELLEVDKTYVFTLKVNRFKIERQNDSKSVDQTVTVVYEEEEPQFTIKCVRNCIKTHPKDITRLVVNCREDCSNKNYTWTLSPKTENFYLDFGNGYDKIVISPDAYVYGEVVTVTVSKGSATAEYKLEFVKGMSRANCTVNPTSGISGVTKFFIQCRGWHSAYGLSKYLVYQYSRHADDGILLSQDIYVHTIEIFLSEGDPTIVLVVAEDHAVVQAVSDFTVDVKPFNEGGLPGTEMLRIETMILSDDPNSIKCLAKKRKRNQVVQMTNILLDALEDAYYAPPSVVKLLHQFIAECLYDVGPIDLFSGLQILSVLTKLQNVKHELDTKTSRLIGKCLLNSMVALHNMTIRGKIKIPFAAQQFFGRRVLDLASLALAQMDLVKELLEQKAQAHDYESYDEMDSEKIDIRNDLTYMTNDIFLALGIEGTNVLHGNLPDERAVELLTDLINFQTRRLNPKNYDEYLIGFPEVSDSYVLIPYELMNELKDKYDYIDYQFIIVKDNPFWWHEKTERYTTDYIMFDMYYKGKKIPQTENPFIVELEAKTVPIGEVEVVALQDGTIATQRIQIEPETTLLVNFDPAMGSYYVVAAHCPCTDENLEDAMFITPDWYEEDLWLLIPPKRGKRIVYLCFKSAAGKDVSISTVFSSFSCNQWRMEEENWNRNECTVTGARLSSNSKLTCECTHACVILGEIFVPPNYINFVNDIDFFVATVRSWPMIGFVSTLLLMWILMLIWAWFRDRRFQKEDMICVLEDNVPGDQNLYIMAIFTGYFYDAETTADVAFRVFGTKSNSRVHLIKCAKTKLLRRDAQDWVAFYTPEELGDIEKIKLWHNCKGRRPHWYCCRILIQHIKSGNQYCFIVEKWFSLIWDGGRVCREIYAKKPQDVKAAKTLFQVKIQTHLRDKHLWLSMIARDPQSNFTSMERVSCAFAFLFLSMLTSAMFFGTPTDPVKNSIDEKPNYYVELRELIIMIESLLISVPIGLLITFIFRNSAPRQ